MTVSLLARLADLISPRACAVCGCRIEVPGHVICAACNMMLPRTSFAEHPYDNVMAKNLWGIVPLEKAVALMRYEHGSQACNIVYGMKYGSHPDFCYQMGRLMAMELMATDFFGDIDVLMPVPLTSKRMVVRGYNQSEEMARGIADITGLPVVSEILDMSQLPLFVSFAVPSSKEARQVLTVGKDRTIWREHGSLPMDIRLQASMWLSLMMW